MYFPKKEVKKDENIIPTNVMLYMWYDISVVVLLGSYPSYSPNLRVRVKAKNKLTAREFKFIKK